MVSPRNGYSPFVDAGPRETFDGVPWGLSGRTERLKSHLCWTTRQTKGDRAVERGLSRGGGLRHKTLNAGPHDVNEEGRVGHRVETVRALRGSWGSSHVQKDLPEPRLTSSSSCSEETTETGIPQGPTHSLSRKRTGLEGRQVGRDLICQDVKNRVTRHDSFGPDGAPTL